MTAFESLSSTHQNQLVREFKSDPKMKTWAEYLVENHDSIENDEIFQKWLEVRHNVKY